MREGVNRKNYTSTSFQENHEKIILCDSTYPAEQINLDLKKD